MWRFGIFVVCGSAMLMMMGLLPSPSSEEFPEALKPQVFVPQAVALLDQPELVEEVQTFVSDLEIPAFIDSVEERVEAIAPRVASIVPSLAEPEALPEPSDAVAETFASVVTFAYNEATLDDPARAALDEVVGWLKENPASEISIFGHTDLVGTEEYNVLLGADRAEEVAAYFVAAGVPEGQISVVRSLGETTPLVVTEDATRDNRRVNIVASRAL